MSSKRHYSAIDQLLIGVDQVVRTLSPAANTAERPSPASGLEEARLSDEEKRHVAGLMRVNHAGEVCAQALYQGQALTAKLPDVRESMNRAAREEIDHLVWCEQRLDQLGSHTSLLNPLWYATSFSIGAMAGALGDKWSLGFVAATEHQVCAHLESHLEQLPTHDTRSRAIIEQMKADEAEHEQMAMEAGGAQFPAPVRQLMTLVSRAMTASSYRI
ncbi:2-polyprenyl-3-methyl-6-methoxy-1,4-benzoquinone monooxygenase [Aestuariirhabdus litorea]|uniref:3-demethoxyubiquinol 3-hydroxylase n=1 Tax=Aestuariirhabdus litorea TaxID=2528527 RepID=A0A3P3VMD9_9GAMM|nr:2-polyprenyl-3-methyl-6-methoxy-1,4-benzoquinone monooxygenase [Aestuariirhabdus litorea]RRJ83855.1 2-polyprenyl-3-methyl-6-methoxy-1,4-benzoquinone monooxygenase [Aestuariirhabdus litorea]RWW97078.1 2-polyprenyl-3-methyl-6-methoxy-1,4-benzoquinone monooxygenase [Endozoicomonadaceae bacterium GTF-13]